MHGKLAFHPERSSTPGGEQAQIGREPVMHTPVVIKHELDPSGVARRVCVLTLACYAFEVCKKS